MLKTFEPGPHFRRCLNDLVKPQAVANIDAHIPQNEGRLFVLHTGQPTLDIVTALEVPTVVAVGVYHLTIKCLQFLPGLLTLSMAHERKLVPVGEGFYGLALDWIFAVAAVQG